MLPSKTPSKSFAQCERHSATANGCGRLTMVAVATTRSREQNFTPRPAELNENPSLRIREKQQRRRCKEPLRRGCKHSQKVISKHVFSAVLAASMYCTCFVYVDIYLYMYTCVQFSNTLLETGPSVVDLNFGF